MMHIVVVSESHLFYGCRYITSSLKTTKSELIDTYVGILQRGYVVVVCGRHARYHRPDLARCVI
ncbi:MAG: hypothetical protein CMF43_05420 [Legionellales bacterium]|nr:hypothetical protein [Legionellales bacterium]